MSFPGFDLAMLVVNRAARSDAELKRIKTLALHEHWLLNYSPDLTVCQAAREKALPWPPGAGSSLVSACSSPSRMVPKSKALSTASARPIISPQVFMVSNQHLPPRTGVCPIPAVGFSFGLLLACFQSCWSRASRGRWKADFIKLAWNAVKLHWLFDNFSPVARSVYYQGFPIGSPQPL